MFGEEGGAKCGTSVEHIQGRVLWCVVWVEPVVVVVFVEVVINESDSVGAFCSDSVVTTRYNNTKTQHATTTCSKNIEKTLYKALYNNSIQKQHTTTSNNKNNNKIWKPHKIKTTVTAPLRSSMKSFDR